MYIHAPVLCSEREHVGTGLNEDADAVAQFVRAAGAGTTHSQCVEHRRRRRRRSRRLGNIGYAVVGGGGHNPGVGRCLAGDRLSDGGGVRPCGLRKRPRESAVAAGVAGADDERAGGVQSGVDGLPQPGARVGGRT